MIQQFTGQGSSVEKEGRGGKVRIRKGTKPREMAEKKKKLNGNL